MGIEDSQPDGLETQVSPLSRVRQGDEQGWTQFYGLYQDFIYAASRGAGLSHEESRDEQAILVEARRRTKERVRLEDYQAYDLFSVKEFAASKVADTLNLCPVTVRVRAFRVRRAVAREIRRIAQSLETTAPRRL